LAEKASPWNVTEPRQETTAPPPPPELVATTTESPRNDAKNQPDTTERETRELPDYMKNNK
jgi:hypothetical protein